jgi:hypothetical protein
LERRYIAAGNIQGERRFAEGKTLDLRRMAALSINCFAEIKTYIRKNTGNDFTLERRVSAKPKLSNNVGALN